MAVVLPGVSFAHAASPNPMQLQGYHIQHQVPPIHQLQAPYSTLQAGQVPFLAPQVLPYRAGSAQPQQHQPQPSSQWPSGPSTYPIQPQPPAQPQIQAPSQPLPPLPPHNEVPLNRDQLANILEYFSTLVPSHFDNRGLRLIVHGGACMLLHPGLYALSKEHEQIARQLSPGSPLYPLPRRQTTRDVDYLHRAFVKDWQRLGVDEANRRLKDCVHVTARAFGLGADWMNSDADISLPMADDGKGKIFDPIYHAALMPNNIDLHTVFMSKNQKLTLVSVAPVWSVALKLRRYAHFDPGDICLILKNGTKLNKVRWSESTLEGWLRKEAWPMGYHNWTDAEVAQWRARVRHAIGLVHAWPSSPVMSTTSIQQQQQQHHHPMPSTTPGPTLYGTPALGPLQPPHQHQHQQNPMFGGQHVLGGRVVAGPGPGPAHPGSQVPTPTPRPSTSHYAGASVSPAGPSTAVAGGTSGTSGNAAAGASLRTRTPGMPLQMYDLNVEREFDDMRLDGPTLRSRQRDRERERDRERGRERDGGVYGGKGHQRAHSSMGVIGTGTGTGTTAMGSHALTLTWHQQAQAQTYSNPNGHHAHSQSLAVPYSQHVADQGTSGYDMSAGRSRSRPSSRNGEADIGLAVLPPTPSPNPERRSRDKDRTRNRRMERLEKMAVRSPDPAANDFNRERKRSRDEGRYYSDRERDRDRDREQAQDSSESRSSSQPPGRQPTPGPSAISRDYAYGSSLAVPGVSSGGHSVDIAAAQGGGNLPGTQHTMWHSYPNPRPATTQPRASPVPGTHLSTWYGQGHHAQPSSLSVPYGSHALGVAGGSNGDLERGRTRSGPPDDGSGSRGRSRSKSQKRRPPPLMLLSPAMTDNLRVFD